MDEPNEPEVAVPPADEYPVRVLLVDDQALIGELVRRALAGERNLEFHHCADPAAALATAERTRPTVILQDLIMPGIDGLDLVRQYRAHAPTSGVPVIMLSSKEDASTKSQAFAAGASDYVVKLPDRIELIARIRHHSIGYLNRLQRDEAYLALRDSQEKLVAANQELQRLTTTDGLTGLSNKRCFLERLDIEWARGARDQSSLSILMIDVDDFKRFNDMYGHLRGDEVLKMVAAVLEESSRRPADLASRFGGEEFVVVLPATPLAGALVVGNVIRSVVEERCQAHAASTVSDHVTVSIGVASGVPRHEDSAFGLVEQADAALYRAKRAGKNRVISGESEVGDGAPSAQ